VAKLTVATVLITWLIHSGALDFSKLLILVKRPSLLALELGVWLIAVFVAALRWRTLLGLAGVTLPFPRILQLQLTALFFNVVIPGNVGGDVVKALYVARDADPKKRTTILLIVFVERLLGLAGLVTMATVVTIANSSTLFANELMRPLATTVCLLGAGLAFGVTLFVLGMRWGGARLESWTSGPSRISKLLAQLVAAMRLLSSGPKELAITLVLSMFAHAAAMTLFTVLTVALTHQDVSFGTVATVFPIGLLSLMLPISPAGMGVGHLAFDSLFSAIKLTGGADVFNVWLIGQIAPNLLGVFPYLALKRRGELPTTDGETA